MKYYNEPNIWQGTYGTVTYVLIFLRSLDSKKQVKDKR